MREDIWDETIDVNLGGVWKTVKAAVPHLLAGGRGGSIIITSSVGGTKAYPQVGHYIAAKHGVVGLMRTFAVELGHQSIRVNTVHPTHVVTPLLMNEATYRLFRPDLENPGPDDLAPICQSFHYLPIPWVEPVDISNAVLFLASDEAPLHHRRHPARRRRQPPEVGDHDDHQRRRRLLRPVRRRHRGRPVADVCAAARGGADLLQRAVPASGRISRHSDVEKALADWETFSNSRSDILELVNSEFDMPKGVMMFEDPPVHTMLRGLMRRVFTPRRMAEIEDQIRQFCVNCLDPHVGSDGFDIIAELASMMPMRVIGMLLGIPESEQIAVRDANDANLRTKPGAPMKVAKADKIADGRIYADYVEWRSQEPVRRPDDRPAQRGVRRRARRHPQAAPQGDPALHRRSSRARATRPPAG